MKRTFLIYFVSCTIGAFPTLRHACFCIRSIEGQTKANDSTGNLIAPY